MITVRELHAIRAILNKAILKAREDDAEQITKLHLAIGEIAEFDQNAIQRQWRDLSKGTLAEGAQLHFRVIPAEVQCMSCFQKYHPKDDKILCSNCGSMGAKILSGEEFYLESIEVEHA
jgi:hydrogenase nickel incorporation protein HypA/HybF